MDEKLVPHVDEQVYLICEILRLGGLNPAVDVNASAWGLSELEPERPPAIRINASTHDAQTSARLYSAGPTGYWLVGEGSGLHRPQPR
jgi:hypothetical protein